MLYFKIEPGTNNILGVLGGPFSQYNTKADSAVNGKAYLVEVEVTDPPYDPATQVKEGPVDAYTGTNAVRIYTVRDKTPQELAAEQLDKDKAALRSAVEDIGIVVLALVDTLVSKGTIVPQDVEPVARKAYQDLKAIADRVKGG